MKRRASQRRGDSAVAIPAFAREVERHVWGSTFPLVAGDDALKTASTFLVKLAKSNAHADHRRFRDTNDLALALEQR